MVGNVVLGQLNLNEEVDVALVVAHNSRQVSEPFGSKVITISLICSAIKSRQILAIRSEAAQCELEGPRITGPITSLNILG